MRTARLLLLLGLLTAACGGGGDTAPDDSTAEQPTTSVSASTSTITTTQPNPSTTSTVPTTAAPPPTTAPPSTTASATTTTIASTLDIDGSPLIEFSIEVGDNVDLERDELVAFVIDTLSDSRSWVGRGAGFRLVDSGGLFTIIVAEPARVDQLCLPLQTIGRFSCARNGWIAINSLRWFGATDEWPADIETYRHYLINHEVGHYVAGPTHASCPGEGQPAPVMMQQTKGLKGCMPNGWVDPE